MIIHSFKVNFYMLKITKLSLRTNNRINNIIINQSNLTQKLLECIKIKININKKIYYKINAILIFHYQIHKKKK